LVLVADVAVRGQEHDGDLHDTVMTPRREPRRLDVDDGNVTSSGCLRSHGSDPPAAPFCPAARLVPRPILHRRRGEIRRASSRYAFLSMRIVRIRAETAPTSALSSTLMLSCRLFGSSCIAFRPSVPRATPGGSL